MRVPAQRTPDSIPPNPKKRGIDLCRRLSGVRAAPPAYPGSLAAQMPATYLRIYADEQGESHLEDVDITFEETDFVPPAPPVLLSSFELASQYGFELVHQGWHGDWHPVPQRVLAIYLAGSGEIEASDGEVRDLVPGTILLAEDTVGKGHKTRVIGSTDMLVVILRLPD